MKTQRSLLEGDLKGMGSEGEEAGGRIPMTFWISGFRLQELLWVLSEEEMSCRQHEVTAVES